MDRDRAFSKKQAEFEMRVREKERAAVLELMRTFAPSAGDSESSAEDSMPAQSFGSFGVRSPVVPVAFVAGGGRRTLLDCEAYLNAGVPLVLVDGCTGVAACLAKRYSIAVIERSTMGRTTGDSSVPASPLDGGCSTDTPGKESLAALKREYDGLVDDSLLDDSADVIASTGIGNPRHLIKRLVDTALALEVAHGTAMVYVGTLGAADPTQTPGSALLRAIEAHPAYRLEERDIDNAPTTPDAVAEYRTRRALRVENAIMWRAVSTTMQQRDEMRLFRLLPTVANDNCGNPLDPMLEPQLLMIKNLLMNSHSNGSGLAQIMLHQVTDRNLRMCLEWTILPPSDLPSVHDGSLDWIQRQASLDVKARHAVQLAHRTLTIKPRVQRMVQHISPQILAAGDESLLSWDMRQDDFDDSDYTLPVHLSKLSVVNRITDCVIEAWLQKRRLQCLRTKADQSGNFTARPHTAKMYRRDFVGLALTLVKYLLANGNCCWALLILNATLVLCSILRLLNRSLTD